MLFFRIVEVKVSSPRYVSLFGSYIFALCHGVQGVLARVRGRAGSKTSCFSTSHTSASTLTPSGTPRDHLRRCHLPRSLPALAPESGSSLHLARQYHVPGLAPSYCATSSFSRDALTVSIFSRIALSDSEDETRTARWAVGVEMLHGALVVDRI